MNNLIVLLVKGGGLGQVSSMLTMDNEKKHDTVITAIDSQ